MKKYALVMALALAASLAQADITVYGKVRMFEENTKTGTAESVTALTNDSSRFGIKASESLANGITAYATIETGIAADAPAATTLGDRISVVGLSNKLGSVALGRDKHTIARTFDNYDAMGILIGYGTSASVIHAAQGTRFQNAVFLTAKPVAGLTAMYAIANSEVAGGATESQSSSVEYTVGPVRATAARLTTGTNSYSGIVGAKLALPSGTTVFGMYSENKVSGVATTGKTVGVNQALGAVTLLAGYGENDTVKAYNVGASYNLSKTTLVHARYVKEDSTTNVQKIGAGLEVNF
jgi:predicted porin